MMAWILRAITLAQLLLSIAIARWLLASAQASWLAIAALAVALMLLLHLTIIVGEFALSRFSASKAPPTQTISTLGWLRAIGGEFTSSWTSFAIRIPLFGNQPLASAPAATRTPIVFIHGYFCNRAVWRPLAAHLARAGHAIGSVNLEPAFGSIDDYPALIDQQIRALQANHASHKVILICHSMGGLAARAYLRRYGNEAIDRVITLGTPHQGTALALHGHGKNVREMRRDSAWRRELEGSESRATGALFTTILSHHDNMVSPQAGQTIPGAQTIEFAGLGHVRLLLDRKVWSAIDKMLTR